jgi:hypothetical protein
MPNKVTKQSKAEHREELRRKMDCGEVQESTHDFYDFLNEKVINKDDTVTEKRRETKSELNTKQGCGDLEDTTDNYDFLNKE